MPVTQTGLREQDMRKLPIKEAQELAAGLLMACVDEDNEALDALGHRLLRNRGYPDDCPIEFTFSVKKYHTDALINIHCWFSIDGNGYSINRSGSEKTILMNDSEEEVYRRGASIALLLNAAIHSCIRSLFYEIIFPREHENFDDAFFHLAKISV